MTYQHLALGIDLLAVAALALLWLRLVHRSGTSASEESGTDEPPPDSALARATAAVGWAEGSRRDWDQHVRPLLAREITDVARSHTRPAGTSPQQAARSLLGARLWSLVDPAQPFTTDLDRPGPGRSELAAVLDELERL